MRQFITPEELEVWLKDSSEALAKAVDEMLASVYASVRKYPAECPCGIQSRDCEYHNE